MRSTRATMRSVSSQISWVSSRPAGVGVLLQQLRRAADAGERVLDLMRQHRRHRGDRARGVAVRQLAIDLVGDRALVQRQHQQVRALAGQRALDRHRTRAEARRFEQHVVFGDRTRRCATPRRSSAKSGLCGRMKSAQRRAAQRRRAGAEELLGRGIDETDRRRRDRARAPDRAAPPAAARRRCAIGAQCAGMRSARGGGACAHAASRSISGS